MRGKQRFDFDAHAVSREGSSVAPHTHTHTHARTHARTHAHARTNERTDARTHTDARRKGLFDWPVAFTKVKLMVGERDRQTDTGTDTDTDTDFTDIRP